MFFHNDGAYIHKQFFKYTTLTAPKGALLFVIQCCKLIKMVSIFIKTVWRVWFKFVSGRVTRLDEFSVIMFVRQFLKIKKEAHIFGPVFSRVKVMFWFWQKWFGRFFHKLIWFQVSLPCTVVIPTIQRRVRKTCYPLVIGWHSRVLDADTILLQKNNKSLVVS
jgi:hypothetical protein